MTVVQSFRDALLGNIKKHTDKEIELKELENRKNQIGAEAHKDLIFSNLSIVASETIGFICYEIDGKVRDRFNSPYDSVSSLSKDGTYSEIYMYCMSGSKDAFSATATYKDGKSNFVLKKVVNEKELIDIKTNSIDVAIDKAAELLTDSIDIYATNKVKASKNLLDIYDYEKKITNPNYKKPVIGFSIR